MLRGCLRYHRRRHARAREGDRWSSKRRRSASKISRSRSPTSPPSRRWCRRPRPAATDARAARAASRPRLLRRRVARHLHARRDQGVRATRGGVGRLRARPGPGTTSPLTDTAAVYWTLLQQLEQQPELWDASGERAGADEGRGRHRVGHVGRRDQRHVPRRGDRPQPLPAAAAGDVDGQGRHQAAAQGPGELADVDEDARACSARCSGASRCSTGRASPAGCARRSNDMGPDRPPIVAGVESLLGTEERLQLYVPITDFFGYDVHIPADDPAWVLDRTHRHVMQFVHDRRDPTLDQLSSRWDDALAFSARATSSFPGAFPPLSIADYERGRHRTTTFDSPQRRTLFALVSGHGRCRRLVLARQDALRRRRRARQQAVRHDPRRHQAAPGGDRGRPPARSTSSRTRASSAAACPTAPRPASCKTIIGGYAGIPRQEPIVLDLTDLGVHNANVARIRDVIETNFEPVRQRVIDVRRRARRARRRHRRRRPGQRRGAQALSAVADDRGRATRTRRTSGCACVPSSTGSPR